MKRLSAALLALAAAVACDRAPSPAPPGPSASGATAAAPSFASAVIPPGEEPGELATEEDFESEAEKLGPADLDTALDQLEREIGD